MKKVPKESIFAVSIAASICPFLFVLFSFFKTGEPYSFMLFCVYLLMGSLLGSILGIISLVFNHKFKSKKIFVLSIIPILLSVILLIGDFISSYHMA